MSGKRSAQIGAEKFARVWQRDKLGEKSECVLVAMFLLDTDASDWVEAQNKIKGQKDLYFYNPGKQNAGR